MISYAPANLLFLLDSRRNMRRTMELISEFDSDTFANQRVRLYEVKNVKPSDVAKDLESIFKSISLDAKTSPVHFMGIDRINTLVAVASNPGAFESVDKWLQKLDVPVKITAGDIENYVYKVFYGRAECLAQALNQVFNPNYVPSFGSSGLGYGQGNGNNGYGGGGGYQNNGAYGGGGGLQAYGGSGSNNGGYGNQNAFNSGFGGSGGCSANGMGGGGGGTYNSAQAYGYPAFGGYQAQANATGQPLGAAAQAGLPIGSAAAAAAGTTATPAVIPPRIIPNPLDNKLIIQANAQQYQSILKILKDLDVPPRQILLEAKIYSVTLSDAFNSNVTATLAKNGGNLGFHQLLGSLASAGTAAIAGGTVVGLSRQLLLSISATENRQYTKLLSEPSLIATDSIPASITVGSQIPVTTGSTVIPSGGNVTSTSSYSSQNTGITLQVNARVNSSGVVTLIINQQISNVSAGSEGSATPAFDQKVVQTQITLMDGDTIAIGGLISETVANNVTGIPGLVRIPWIGWLFGNKTVSKGRDELIMFFTPHVIFDEANLIEASDEFRSQIRLLKRELRRL